MAFIPFGYKANGAAYAYTTFASAQTAASAADVLIPMYSGTKMKREWTGMVISKAISLIGGLPYRGAVVASVDTTTSATVENLTLKAGAGVPGAYVKTAAQTSYYRNLVVIGSTYNGAFFASVAADATMVAQNCSAVGIYGFRTNATAGAVIRAHHCSTVFDAYSGFSQAHASTGVVYPYDCLSAHCRVNDFGGAIALAGGDNNAGTDRITTYTANLTNTRWFDGTDNPLRLLVNMGRGDPATPWRIASDSPLVGAGAVRDNSLPYDIDYRPWPGGVPSIGCSAGVDLNPKFRRGVFGRNRLAFRVGEYIHPDAPWIKYAGYIN